MNIMKLGQLKPKFGDFQNRHPKFVQFFTAALPENVKEGSILEIKIKNPDGREICTNMKVAAEDEQFLKDVVSLMSN